MTFWTLLMLACVPLDWHVFGPVYAFGWLVVTLVVTIADIRFRASRRANLDRFYLIQTPWFGVFLHRIKKSDKEGVYHTHPWSWFSIVFGRYIDVRLAPADRGELSFLGQPVYVNRKAGFNSCPAGLAHRVVLEGDKPVWTLCFRGPRRCQWKVIDTNRNVVEIEPWSGTEKPERVEYAQ